VSNNIAEGFERGTTHELLASIYIARGSAGEVRSMLCFLERRPRFVNLKFQVQIHCGDLLAPAAGPGGLPAELGDQGPTSSERY